MFDQDGPVLEEGVVDTPADVGETVEIVQIKLPGYGDGDTEFSSQCASLLIVATTTTRTRLD